MKFMKGITIIFGITVIGEFLNVLLPFPIPSGVYGLFLLLALLCLKAVKLEAVEGPGNFFSGYHASDVYSGRRGPYKQLGFDEKYFDSPHGDYSGINSFCHGCDWKNGSVSDQKEAAEVTCTAKAEDVAGKENERWKN